MKVSPFFYIKTCHCEQCRLLRGAVGFSQKNLNLKDKRNARIEIVRCCVYYI